MLRALAGLLLLLAIVVTGWSVLAANETPNATTPAAGPAGGANAPATADGQTPATAGTPAGAANPGAGGAAAPNAGAAPAGQAPAPSTDKANAGGSPIDTAKSAAKGSLKSAYPDFAKVADEGHQKFTAAGCNGCHGGTGGGGMGPPLTNQVWVYGKDDDTLFRLVALGSDELQKQGYSRIGTETVVGPMPPMGGVVKSNDDLWKIIAWIRSVNPSSTGASSGSAAPPATPPQ
jgi:mono/diheme cytochrome c family protein